MKLIIAIINHDDAHAVIKNLTTEGYYVTKLATTGGFLQVGNVTVLVGTEDDKTEAALAIIEKHSISRKQLIPTLSELGVGVSSPVEVTVGGATVFVVDVEAFSRF